MIPTQLLTTKLYPPPPRTYLVARPRLVERLNAGLQPGRQLILVSATAGFGKTTLASEWITGARLEPSIAWISLDKDDNNPIRFLFYLIAALQKVDPGIGENLLPVLQSPQPAPLNELAAQLINQIAASEKQVLLTLDDYHLITSPEVHQVVQLFIERQPNQMHTLILTREDPPFPIPRMRARGQVTEIRERDLRFTLPEAETFLNKAMGLCLSPDDVGKLAVRTEGWVAGMQLAALALDDYPDEGGRRAFIEAFAGSDRFIVDYLVSEVLERQTEPARQFLLCTSILERFCADLCDQVVYEEAGMGRSQPVLEGLEQGNMFLVPLDNQRKWYRYHHLFSEMLAHSLRRSSPDRVPELHRRASDWFETAGYTQEAVKHAQAAADWDLAAALLDRHAMRMLFQGQGYLVLEWCGGFPKEYLEKKPAICIYFAWALVLTFRNDYLDAIQEKLQLAGRAIEDPDLPEHARVGHGGLLVPLRDWAIGQICVVRSQLLLARFNTYVDPQELILLSLKGLELLPESEKPIRAICKVNLAHAQAMQSNPLEAQRAFEEALPYMLEANNYLGAVTCIFYLARLAYYLGDMDRAEALCRQWKAKYSAVFGQTERDVPATRGLDIVLSLILLERGQFDEAERLLDRTLGLLGWASWMELHGFIMLARLRHLRGDDAAAGETLGRMADLGPQHASCAEALRMLFEVRRSPDDPHLRARAETWAKLHAPNAAVPLALGIGPYHCDAEYFCNLAWARVQICLGVPEEALTFIEPALASAWEHGLVFRIVELITALARAADAHGDHPSAVAILGEALEIAEPYGYVRVFDDGPELDRLLADSAGRNARASYVHWLMASFKRAPTGEPAAGKLRMPQAASTSPRERRAHPGLVEALSERELEVLRLIADGLTNAEIARKLYLSPNTLKAHTQSIYGKLDVHGRVQAVNRAREMSLLGV